MTSRADGPTCLCLLTRTVTRSEHSDTFCSVRVIKRGSGALVHTEERERGSARRQQHGSARDNMISALLGPRRSPARRSAGTIVSGETDFTLDPAHGSYWLPIDLFKEVTPLTASSFPPHAGAPLAPERLCHRFLAQVNIISHFICPLKKKKKLFGDKRADICCFSHICSCNHVKCVIIDLKSVIALKLSHPPPPPLSCCLIFSDELTAALMIRASPSGQEIVHDEKEKSGKASED